MKKLIVALMVLGSFSSFSSEVKYYCSSLMGDTLPFPPGIVREFFPNTTIVVLKFDDEWNSLDVLEYGSIALSPGQILHS
jgi:hypothetical protein